MKPIVLIAYKSDGATTSRGCEMDRWYSAFNCDWFPDFTNPRFSRALQELHWHNIVYADATYRDLGSFPDGHYQIWLAVGEALLEVQDRFIVQNCSNDEETPDWMPRLEEVLEAVFELAQSQVREQLELHKRKAQQKMAEQQSRKEATERTELERLKAKYES